MEWVSAVTVERTDLLSRVFGVKIWCQELNPALDVIQGPPGVCILKTTFSGLLLFSGASSNQHWVQTAVEGDQGDG